MHNIFKSLYIVLTLSLRAVNVKRFHEISIASANIAVHLLAVAIVKGQQKSITSSYRHQLSGQSIKQFDGLKKLSVDSRWTELDLFLRRAGPYAIQYSWNDSSTREWHWF